MVWLAMTMLLMKARNDASSPFHSGRFARLFVLQNILTFASSIYTVCTVAEWPNWALIHETINGLYVIYNPWIINSIYRKWENEQRRERRARCGKRKESTMSSHWFIYDYYRYYDEADKRASVSAQKRAHWLSACVIIIIITFGQAKNLIFCRCGAHCAYAMPPSWTNRTRSERLRKKNTYIYGFNMFK